ncbi:MAG: NAD-dependent epimerase/dehydratase family protein, partial [Planctomycetia bacterium]
MTTADRPTKRALVTGASGFAGGHLVERLLAEGCQVFGLGRPPTADQGKPPFAGHPRYTGVFADVADAAAVSRALADARPDEVYHLAGVAVPAVAARDPAEANRVNVDGTRILLEAVVRHAPAAAVLHVSTGHVYGVPPTVGHVFRSDQDEPRPNSAYSRSKWEGELAARDAARRLGLRLVVARPFNHVGPRQTIDYVIASIASQIVALERRPTERGALSVGRLDVARDFT